MSALKELKTGKSELFSRIEDRFDRLDLNESFGCFNGSFLDRQARISESDGAEPTVHFLDLLAPQRFPKIRIGFESVLIALLGLALLLSSAAFGGELPYSRKHLKQINDTFFTSSVGAVSESKVNLYEAGAFQRYQELKNIFENGLRRDGMTDPKLIEEEIQDEDLVKIFEIWLERIRQLKGYAEPDGARRLAHDILELDYSLKIEGDPTWMQTKFNYLKVYFKTWSVKKTSKLEAEASNLVNPATGKFVTVDDMKIMGDLSKLDPPAATAFWQNRDISKVDVTKSNHEGDDRIHQGYQFEFPNEGTFTAIRKTQSKPKIDFTSVMSNGKKKKYKLKVGVEIHAEPTVTALLSALGYASDPVKYVRDFKLYLGKTSLEDFKKDWISYYRRSKFHPDNFIKSVGQDEKGRYIVLVEGMIENKPDGNRIQRVGPWAWGTNGHESLRELRALMMFNIWVANADLKEAENNKLVLHQKSKDEPYQVLGMQHDNGFAFGYILREKPADYAWDIIEKNASDRVDLHYTAFQENSMLGKITWADARWAVRQIAKLSRKQIQDAVDHGGWPPSVGALLVEKMIKRRNDLVKTFGLEGELLVLDDKVIAEIPVDREITTSDGAVVKGELVKTVFDGYIYDFGNTFTEFVTPILEYFRDQLAEGLKAASGSYNNITIDPVSIGFDEGVISEVLLGATREVQKNPEPKDSEDGYLVQDVVRIGFRFGLGYVVSGDVSYVKTYTMVYPVRDREAGQYANKFVLNPFLPFEVQFGGLPKRFVLMVEDSLEGRGRLKLGGTIQGSLMGIEGYTSAVRLKRAVLEVKNNSEVLAYEDTSLYTEDGARILVELGLLKLPVAATKFRKGFLNGTAYHLNLRDDAAMVTKISNEITEIIEYGDFSGVPELASAREFEVKFDEEESSWNFFGFFGGRSRSRYEEILAWDKTTLKQACSGELQCLVQYRSEKESFWDFLTNGEQHRVRTTVFGVMNESRTKIEKPMVQLQYYVKDKLSETHEFEPAYLGFLNGVSGDRDFIPFTPSKHTVNDIWGEMVVQSNIYFYEEAIRKLLALGHENNRIGKEQFVESLAEAAGLSKKLGPKYFALFKKHGDGARVFIPEKHEHFVKSLKGVVWFFSRLKQALIDPDLDDQVTNIANALGEAAARNKEFYNPTLLGTIVRFAGFDNVYMNASIGSPPDRENKLLDHEYLYGEKGTWQELQGKYLIFSPWEPYELYTMMDTLLR